MMMRVGFAGLGRMGTAMAENVAKAGFPLTVWNRSADKAETLARQVSCAVASSPAHLAACSDVVLTMLADDHASAQVHGGEDGLFVAPGERLFVEMGTMSPQHIEHLAASLPSGCRIIDAPVSGATQAAQQAQLLVMAGCSTDQADTVAPLFAAMARQTLYLGRLGRGSIMKLAVNALLHGLNQNLAEALALVNAAGIDGETAFDVIENSAAAAPMLSYRRPLYLDEAEHPVSFTLALARKDMAITTHLAEHLGVAMPQGKVTLRILRDAEAAGYGQRDMAAIVHYMRENN